MSSDAPRIDSSAFIVLAGLGAILLIATVFLSLFQQSEFMAGHGVR